MWFKLGKKSAQNKRKRGLWSELLRWPKVGEIWQGENTERMTYLNRKTTRTATITVNLLKSTKDNISRERKNQILFNAAKVPGETINKQTNK